MSSLNTYFQAVPELTENKIKLAIADALKKIDKMMIKFDEFFPSSCTQNGIYNAVENTGGWTTCFWTGQLWLAYELTGNEKYKKCALDHMESFENRAVNRIGMDDHDIGFNFTLSTIAGYKVTGNEHLRKISLMAAEQQLGRFREKGGFIQLAGNSEGPIEYYRLIIDCLMNVHILYWAAKETGKEEYFNAAKTHFYTTIKNAIRENGSAYQNIYFDPNTGKVIGKGTKQGVSDEACWSRGQAWVIYGLPLSYVQLGDSKIFDIYEKAVEYFFSNSPKDYVPYWDFIFTEADNQPRDSSAAAIAVCGLLEASKALSNDDPRKELWKNGADCIMNSLIDNYTSKNEPDVEGLLLHGCYHVRRNLGVDECMAWGDYFYMEALMRYTNCDWEKYW